MFQISFDKQVYKDLKNLSTHESRNLVDIIIQKLSLNPFPTQIGNPKKLKNSSSFRLRIGKYRVLYEIHGNMVEISAIQHRKDVYKHL